MPASSVNSSTAQMRAPDLLDLGLPERRAMA
jgi:hypothetical protein